MENKFELVEKYNIDVDVFIDEDGVTPVGKLPDNHLDDFKRKGNLSS